MPQTTRNIKPKAMKTNGNFDVDVPKTSPSVPVGDIFIVGLKLPFAEVGEADGVGVFVVVTVGDLEGLGVGVFVGVGIDVEAGIDVFCGMEIAVGGTGVSVTFTATVTELLENEPDEVINLLSFTI